MPLLAGDWDAAAEADVHLDVHRGAGIHLYRTRRCSALTGYSTSCAGLVGGPVGVGGLTATEYREQKCPSVAWAPAALRTQPDDLGSLSDILSDLDDGVGNEPVIFRVSQRVPDGQTYCEPVMHHV